MSSLKMLCPLAIFCWLVFSRSKGNSPEFGSDTPDIKSPPVNCPAKLFMLAIGSRLTCVSSTLNGGISAGAVTITLVSSSGFSASGNGDIDGDSFAWTGNAANQLTGCSGISADHVTGTAVNEGEEAHVLREICADLAAALYFEDESLFQTTGTPGGLRGTAMMERGTENLRRLAHLGSVD